MVLQKTGVFLAGWLVASAVSALGTPEWAKPYMGKPIPSGPYITPDDRWAAVYAEVTFTLTGEQRLCERWRLLFENLAQAPAPFELSLAFDAGQDTLVEPEIHVQRRLWHKLSWAKKSLAATHSSAQTTVLVTAEDIEPGRRVAVEYTLEDRIGFLPWRVVALPLPYPVAELRVGVDEAAARQGVSLDLRSPWENHANFQRVSATSWAVKEIPAASALATTAEPWQPAWDSRQPYFVAWRSGTSAESFRAFATEYGKAWENGLATREESDAQAVAGSLVNGQQTWLEKVKALTGFVQNAIAYDDATLASVENWVPLKAAETLRSRRGDCKGKTALLQALLASLGVRSTPVLVRIEDDYYAPPAQPASAFYNHVVLAVEPPRDMPPLPASLVGGPLEGWVLVDPTLTTVAFGEPLPGFEGLPALAITETPEPYFTVATREPSVARLTAEVGYKLNGGGVLEVSLKLRDNGLSPVLGAMALATRSSEQRDLLQSYVASWLPAAKLASFRFTVAEKTKSGELELDATLVCDPALTVLGSRQLLPSPFALVLALAQPPDLATALSTKGKTAGPQTWVVTGNASGRAWAVKVKGEVFLAPQWEAVPPRPAAWEAPWLGFQSGWDKVSGGSFQGWCHISVPRGSWRAEKLAERRSLLAKTREALSEPWILKKGAP